MQVRVRLFAGTRDAVGAASLDVEVPEGARVDDLVATLCLAHPRLEAYREHALLAVDGAYSTGAAPLRPGSELAIMPPVSGGAGALREGPFSLDALVQELETQGAGAVVGFVGLVRDTSGERRGEPVESLHFEAFAPLAEREIETLRREATAKFALTGCLVRHRLGTLGVGEPIVAVVTAAAHRRAAFEAAMWLMDELKTRVPVWKRERFSSGEARWVNDPTLGRPSA